MTREQLDAIFDRVRAWPAERQEEAAAILLALEFEADDEPAELTEEELADLNEGLAEADRGDFVPDEEMKAFFKRYR